MLAMGGWVAYIHRRGRSMVVRVPVVFVDVWVDGWGKEAGRRYGVCEFENGFVGVSEWLIDCPMCDGCA